MTKKLHIKTWGCQMNEYDSSKMADLLDATHGYQLTDVAEEADVLLRPGVHFHHGRELEMDDVIASLKRINTLPLYSHIADIVSPTPWTLDIHLTQPATSNRPFCELKPLMPSAYWNARLPSGVTTSLLVVSFLAVADQVATA